MIKRLFNTEDGPLSESLVPEGSGVNLKINRVIDQLVTELAAEGWSMRDVEILMINRVGLQCAKQIILRRKWLDNVPR